MAAQTAVTLAVVAMAAAVLAAVAMAEEVMAEEAMVGVERVAVVTVGVALAVEANTHQVAQVAAEARTRRSGTSTPIPSPGSRAALPQARTRRSRC